MTRCFLVTIQRPSFNPTYSFIIKMKSEFKLSDKIEVFDKENDDNILRVRNVKEFIKRLKEDKEIKGWENIKIKRLINIIDKLAGDLK